MLIPEGTAAYLQQLTLSRILYNADLWREVVAGSLAQKILVYSPQFEQREYSR